MGRLRQANHDLAAAAFLALTIVIASLAGPRAQQGGASTPPKALVPVAASTLAKNPDAYYGERVTLTGTVEHSLSRLAFSVDQDKTKNTGNEVLVLAPRLNAPVDLNTYVTVLGDVLRFDPEEIADKTKGYRLDFAPDVAAKYRGRPVILATAVINTAGVDLAMRLPPPMTAEEEAYSKLMKQVGPANAALRKAIEGMDAKLAQENTAVLKQAFTKVEAFWKAKRKADATEWAQEAQKHVESFERAAAGGKWDEAKASAGSLGQLCQSCHTAHRERFDEGSFRIKTGTN